MTTADDQRARALGLADNGSVSIRSFDEGVMLTLRAAVERDGYYLDVQSAQAFAHPIPVASRGSKSTPGMKVPVIFYNPEDQLAQFTYPLILVRRTGLNRAPQRWHPGQHQYRAPTVGADPRVVGTRTGPSKVTVREQAVPYDFQYDVVVLGRYRGTDTNAGQPHQVQALLLHVLRVFEPGVFIVRDSLDDLRAYEVRASDPTDADELFDVGDRTIGWSVSITVEGELDVLDPVDVTTVGSLDLRTGVKL